jgi:hypothetical protein
VGRARPAGTDVGDSPESPRTSSRRSTASGPGSTPAAASRSASSSMGSTSSTEDLGGAARVVTRRQAPGRGGRFPHACDNITGGPTRTGEAWWRRRSGTGPG